MRKGQKNVLKLGLILILFFLILTGCARQDSPAEKDSVVVGFSQLGAESSWRIANTASMEQSAREFGFGLMMENANQKQEKQIDAIRSFISYRVDVIVFSPIVQTGWDHVLKEAKQAGIPVILMDRMIKTEDDSLYTAYVGADFYAEGRRAGEYLIRKADTLNQDHFRIVEICGTTDSTPMRDRQRGFMDVIRKDSRFSVIASVNGDFLRSKGEECMRELLQQYGENGFDVIFSHNDAMMLGALDVLKTINDPAVDNIIRITVDGEKEVVDALKEGRINCVVQCTPHLGPSVMSVVKDICEGKEVRKTYHPDEGVFSDLDDLTDSAVEGF